MSGMSLKSLLPCPKQDVKEEPSVEEVVAAYTPEYMVNEGIGNDIESHPPKPQESDLVPLRSSSAKSA
jgi:hypothetical protein